MRRLVMLAIVLANSTGFSAGLISNGSFEADGAISNIFTMPPLDWDVNIPVKFSGDIVNSWHSDGNYSLRIVTNKSQTFVIDANAYVSQEVDLTDVSKVYFDINLRGYYLGSVAPWDANYVRAFVKVDNSYIWVSDMTFKGEHYDVNVPLNYDGVHTLKFGIRVVSDQKVNPSYWAQFDYIKFNALCGGYGHFEADINRDCYVDFEDMYVLADNWLRTDLTDNDYRLNLHYDSIINLQDFAILADQWMLCSNWQDDRCIRVPLDLDGDLNQDGIVNFVDYAILMNEPDADYSDVNLIKEQWLHKNWLFQK